MVFLFLGQARALPPFSQKIQISRHFVPRNGGGKRKDKTSSQF
jgi:hypothetical protein